MSMQYIHTCIRRYMWHPYSFMLLRARLCSLLRTAYTLCLQSKRMKIKEKDKRMSIVSFHIFFDFFFAMYIYRSSVRTYLRKTNSKLSRQIILLAYNPAPRSSLPASYTLHFSDRSLILTAAASEVVVCECVCVSRIFCSRSLPAMSECVCNYNVNKPTICSQRNAHKS